MGAVPSAFRLRSLSFERSWRFVLVGRSFNCVVPLPVDYILAKKNHRFPYFQEDGKTKTLATFRVTRACSQIENYGVNMV